MTFATMSFPCTYASTIRIHIPCCPTHSQHPTHLDGLCCVQLLGWWDPGFSLSQELEDEISDVSASNGDVLNAAADDVTLGNGNNVGDPITGVNDRTSECSLPNLL